MCFHLRSDFSKLLCSRTVSTFLKSSRKGKSLILSLDNRCWWLAHQFSVGIPNCLKKFWWFKPVGIFCLVFLKAFSNVFQSFSVSNRSVGSNWFIVNRGIAFIETSRSITLSWSWTVNIDEITSPDSAPLVTSKKVAVYINFDKY